MEHFSKQLEFFCEIVLLKFNLLCFIAMSFSHLLCILALGFFFGDIENVPTAQEPKNVRELEAAIRLEWTNLPGIIVQREFDGRFRGAISSSEYYN